MLTNIGFGAKREDETVGWAIFPLVDQQRGEPVFASLSFTVE